MKRSTSRLIFWLSVFIFILASVYISLYSFGYRIDFKSFRLIQTGAVFVKTQPKKSIVMLSGKIVGITSIIDGEFIEKSILPGKYGLKVIKEDRQTWTKNLEIKAKEASRFLYVYLPPQILESESIDSTLARQLMKELQSGLIPDKSYQINLKDHKVYKKSRNDTIEKISDETFDVKYKFLDVFPLESQIYVIAKISQQALSGNLFVLDGNIWKLVAQNVIALTLAEDSKKLAILSKNEIIVRWIKDESAPPFYKKDQQELIVRLTRNISQLSWFTDSEHLLFLANGKVFIAELDTRSPRNIYELMGGITSFVYDKSNSTLILESSGEFFKAKLD